MDELTRERRMQMRAVIEDRGQAAARIGDDELLSLLAAADERDRLREEVQRLKDEAEDAALEWKETLSRYDD